MSLGIKIEYRVADEFKGQLKKLVAENRVEDASNLLLNYLKNDTENYKEVLIWKSRYQQIKLAELKDTMPSDFVVREGNRLTMNLLDIIDKATPNDFKEPLNSFKDDKEISFWSKIQSLFS